MTSPSEPPTPVIKRISPLVRKPSESAVAVRSTPIERRASRNAQSRPTNSARLALPMKSMKSLETPARSANAPKAIIRSGTTIGATETGRLGILSPCSGSISASWASTSSIASSGSSSVSRFQ